MKIVLNMVVSNAIEACRLYENVFDGKVFDVFEFPDRPKSNEASIVIGDFTMRLIDENPEFECFSPIKNESCPIWLEVNVKDLDYTYKKALENGMTTVQEINNHLGKNFAEVKDVYGYSWVISQTLKEVTYEERMDFYNKYHSEFDAKE